MPQLVTPSEDDEAKWVFGELTVKKVQETQPDSQGREIRKENPAGKMDYRKYWLPSSTFDGRLLLVVQRKNRLWKT
jgi:predicted transcriptional regulator